ncbi:DUF5906 domain-containing protein [Bacillus sp. AFS055030]|uniref:DNA primase family protein n=1 Tax=Bacillus sp. AFS055030 TaxID=2033507 RepID=UPI000BFE51F7|nr:DUF5906 domain-containing protein [Bacillus sp. AFS055030]PGL66843.1 hypothetical protein CN925_20640 [Bacillus sp. AFS055030]
MKTKIATEAAKTKKETDEIIVATISSDDLDIDLEKIVDVMTDYFDIQKLDLDEDYARMYFRKPENYVHEPEGLCVLGFKMNWELCSAKEVDLNLDDLEQELPDFLTSFIDAKNFFEGLSDSAINTSLIHGNPKRIFNLFNRRKNLLFDYKRIIKHLEYHEEILQFIDEILKERQYEINEQLDDNLKIEKNNEQEVAEKLIHKLKTVKFNDSLYTYHHKCFRTGDFLAQNVIRELKGFGVSSRYLNEVVKQIKIHSPSIEKPQDGWSIKFQNGCLYNGEWYPIDFTGFTPHYINLRYDPHAESVPVVDRFLNFFTGDDEDYRNFILETIALCLITDPNVKRFEDFQRITFFHGDGKNGKGVLLNIIRALLGGENVSSLSLENIIDEKYLFSLRNKLANCGDDLENKPINARTTKALKNLASNDPIQIRKMYENSTEEVLTATHIYSTNHILTSSEKGNAWKRRLIWCPAFEKPIVKDPDLQKKLTQQDALEYMLRLVMEAYFRLYEKRAFTKCQKVQDCTDNYHEENNTALSWIRAKGKDFFINKRSPQVYNDNKGDDFATWHKENYGGRPPINCIQLKESIMEVHNLVVKPTTVKGKPERVFKEN